MGILSPGNIGWAFLGAVSHLCPLALSDFWSPWCPGKGVQKVRQKPRKLTARRFSHPRVMGGHLLAYFQNFLEDDSCREETASSPEVSNWAADCGELLLLSRQWNNTGFLTSPASLYSLDIYYLAHYLHHLAAAWTILCVIICILLLPIPHVHLLTLQPTQRHLVFLLRLRLLLCIVLITAPPTHTHYGDVAGQRRVTEDYLSRILGASERTLSHRAPREQREQGVITRLPGFKPPPISYCTTQGVNSVLWGDSGRGRVGGRLERGDRWILMADSHCCRPDTNMTL